VGNGWLGKQAENVSLPRGAVTYSSIFPLPLSTFYFPFSTIPPVSFPLDQSLSRGLCWRIRRNAVKGKGGIALAQGLWRAPWPSHTAPGGEGGGGTVAISGAAQVGETLTADTSGLDWSRTFFIPVGEGR